jgi:hypothetical protein
MIPVTSGHYSEISETAVAASLMLVANNSTNRSESIYDLGHDRGHNGGHAALSIDFLTIFLT